MRRAEDGMMLTAGFATAGVWRMRAAVCIALALVCSPVSAAEKTDLDPIKQQLGKLTEGNSTLPLQLQADNLIYDRENDRVVARGNVEVYYKNYALQADELIYDRKVNTLNAIGNVRIKEPDGALINADNISLTEDFREGFIQSFQAVTKDDARINATRAYRQAGETTVFENGNYSPCKICVENPSKPPLWRIKASKVIHKKSEGQIYYEDAVLEMFGLPVVYLPGFNHPDPTVKRRSGFLSPVFGSSSDLGGRVEVPYYFALSPSYDLTLAPTLTTEAGILVKSEWRQRFNNGAYKVQIAGVYDDDPDDSFGKDEFRGSIETKGEFNINPLWRFGWDAIAESDDTFRRFYKLDGVFVTDRISTAYLVGQSDRNYFAANLYHFGGLTYRDDDESDSRVHPVIDYNYIFSDPVLGGELSFDSNVLSLSRDDGADTNRLITQAKWRRTLTDSIGQQITPFVSGRGDLYRVSSFDNGVDAGREDEFTRGTVTAGVEYRYPFIKATETASHVIEPIAQIIARPNINNQTGVPNEDAQSLVFDDTLLFDWDKYSGYDRVETGTRANYGLQYTIQSFSGWSLRSLFGQSYHIAGDNPYARAGSEDEPGDTGLETDQSDYVAGFYLDLTQHLQLISQTRFDDEDFSVRRQDIAVTASYGPVLTSINYVDADAQPMLAVDDPRFGAPREEIAAFGALRLSDVWTVFGDVRYDLALDQAIRDSVGIKYADECFMISVAYTQTYVEDGEIQPDQSVLLRFDFKNLGGNESNTDLIGSFNPETSMLR